MTIGEKITHLRCSLDISQEALADKLSVSHGQAIRYLNILERERILQGNDRKRGRLFFFGELMDLARGI